MIGSVFLSDSIALSPYSAIQPQKWYRKNENENKRRRRRRNKNVKKTKRYLLLNWTRGTTLHPHPALSILIFIFIIIAILFFIIFVFYSVFGFWKERFLVFADTLWWNLNYYCLYFLSVYIEHTCYIHVNPLSLTNTCPNTKKERKKEKSFAVAHQSLPEASNDLKGKGQITEVPWFRSIRRYLTQKSHKREREGRCLKSSPQVQDW